MANFYESEINGFINSLLADGKSHCTISAYRGDLNGFEKSMENMPLTTIKYADLRVWAYGLTAEGLSAATRSRKISAVKSFFRYCFKMGITDKNPADGLECPKIERKQPKVISSADVSNVLQTVYSGHNGTVTWFRDYAILSTFLYTGVRREELTNIKLSDVDLVRCSILINGKGSKQRYVYINDTLLAVLSEYMEWHRHLFKTAVESEYLFPSTMSVKLSLKTVNNIVNKAFEQAGIKEYGVSAHNLRKRFATSVFQETGNIATVSKLLGHSSSTVTMRYVVIDENSMKAAVNTVNF